MNANHHSFIHRTRDLFRLAWEESLKSLRANLIPGLILQAVMAAMAAAYLWHPGARHLFTELARIRSDWGLWFSFLGTSLASALLPEILRGFRRTSAADGPPLRERLLFAIPFWGLIGVQVDLFYRLQLHLFGPSESISVIVTKVLVDAFLYCPLLAMPEAVCVFLWRDHGFTRRGFHGWTPGRFYALRIFPVLMANWMVWIPLVSIIYSLPPALGIPFFIIAQAFWVMVFTTLSARSGKAG
jgi:hypothetical protein